MEGGKTDIDTLIVIVTLASIQKRRASREGCMKNIHVQTVELIEGSFDSSTWSVLFLCVY
jgi:hypothetical protein